MKYVIGIDLGTTNCAVSYARMDNEAKIKTFSIPQLTENGLEEKDLLPSALYLPEGHEIAENETVLPWEAPKHYFTGAKALSLGRKIPSRLVLSAKSWLAVSFSGRSDAILPIAADPSLQKISPIEALKRLIDHIKRAWNFTHKEHPLEEQFVVLTVPASFDEKARRMVLQAMEKAGIKQFTFLEEPQSAFYHLLSTAVDRFTAGDCILVCDIGGGTTDFSLIEVKEGAKGLVFERVLVGEHLLIGGDNIDNDLAFRLKERIESAGGKIKEDDWLLLVQEARRAKEEGFFKEIVLFGSSRELIRSMQKVLIYRKDFEEGVSAFFQFLPWEEAKMPSIGKGMRTFGLPFEGEPNILKHLARFLSSYKGEFKVSHVLFNGGQTKEPLVQEKILDALKKWFPSNTVNPLPLLEPELAVCKGAVAFGLAKQKIRGQKIQGGSSRSYFLEVEPHANEGKSGVLVLPSGFEFGETATIDPLFLLKTNKPVQFNLYSSSTKGRLGDIAFLNADEFSMQGRLHGEIRVKEAAEHLPVFLEAHLTEIGILEIRARAKDTGALFTFEFSLDNKAKEKQIVHSEKIDPEIILKMKKTLIESFGHKNLWQMLEQEASKERQEWPAALLRELFDTLIEGVDAKMRAKEKARFWNTLGFLMRPGIGYPLDQERIAKIWKIILQEGLENFSEERELQMWIALRRIAAGLSKGQQIFCKTPLFKRLFGSNPSRIEPKGRSEQYLMEELIRTLGSLELIEIKDKVKLGNALLECIEKGNAKKGYLWSLGRLGTRVPVFATAGSLISKDVIEKWLERLLALASQDSREWKLLLMQLARYTPLPHLQVSDSLREVVKNSLSDFEDLKRTLDETDHIETEMQEELIGDSIPIGVALFG